MHIVDLIAAKRDGHSISSNDMHELILGYTATDIPDYQMAAFLMAGYLRGFSTRRRFPSPTPCSPQEHSSTSPNSPARPLTSIRPGALVIAPRSSSRLWPRSSACR